MTLLADFAVTDDNPLPGLDGRAALLSRLGRTMLENPEVFARSDAARPGGLFDHLVALNGQSISAAAILRELLMHFGRYGRTG